MSDSNNKSSSSSRARRPRKPSGASRSVAEDAETTIDKAESMIDDATQLVGHVQQVKGHWQQRAVSVASEHPYTALAAAAGTGFVLGGGLSLMLSRRLWKIGGRLAMSLVLQRLTSGSFLSDVRDTIEG